VIRALLDTNICIYIKDRNVPTIRARFEEFSRGELGVSIFTVAELAFGNALSQRRADSELKTAAFLADLIVCQTTDAVANAYADIRAHLQRAGTPIGNNDLWIAAHARALEVTLVSNNIREFQRVPHLKLEQWL
jgi:tRNA(fMet)-specific endonuclease VapC